MKFPFVFAAVLLAAGQLSAQNQPVPPPAAPPAAPKTAVVSPATTTPPAAATAAKPAVKKPEVAPVIPGQTVNRANGTFLGLQVINGNFVLSFYDKKKKPMAPDVTRASARWPNLRSATTGDNRAVLNREGNALVGNKPVVPPLVFTLRLSLLQGDAEEAKVVESFVIAFRG